jgi:hypothetical protein
MALKLPLNPSPLMKRYAVIACLTLLVSHGVCAQSSGTQALSKEDLNQINNQPLAPRKSVNPALNTPILLAPKSANTEIAIYQLKLK